MDNKILMDLTDLTDLMDLTSIVPIAQLWQLPTATATWKIQMWYARL